MTEKEVEDYKKLQDVVSNRVYEISEYYSKYEPHGSITSFEVCDENVYVNWESNWSYGGHEEGMFDFPAYLLIEDYKPYVDNLIKEKERKKKKIDSDIKNYEELKERKILKELKEKYEKSI